MLNIVTGYAETIRFGVFSAPPWGMETEGGINGITVDQIKAIVDHAGFDMQISFSPYPRMIKQLNEGVIDCAIATINPSTDESVVYLSALYNLDIAVISRRDNRLKSDEELLSLTENPVVGFANGTGHFHPKLYQNRNAVKQLLVGHHQGPIMLSKSRIDAFVGIEKLLLYEIRRSGLLDQIYFPGYQVSKVTMWLQCSNKSEGFYHYESKLRDAAKWLKSQSVYTAILDRWIPPLRKDESDLRLKKTYID